MNDDLSTKDLLKLLAPFLAMTAIATAMAVLLAIKFLPTFKLSAEASVVSFDVVKYTNAQRAVASTFLKRDGDVAGANELLLNLPERARKTISEVAGDGTLVVVKQAVIEGTTRDITDEVLTRLGLPTEVPTADAPDYVLNTAPTSLFGNMIPKREAPPPVSTPQVLP